MKDKAEIRCSVQARGGALYDDTDVSGSVGAAVYGVACIINYIAEQMNKEPEIITGIALEIIKLGKYSLQNEGGNDNG